MKRKILNEAKQLDDREIEKYFAVRLFNYRLCKIGADARGENAGEILAPFGKIPKDYELPRVGKIPETWLVDRYISGINKITDMKKIENIIVGRGLGNELVKNLKLVRGLKNPSVIELLHSSFRERAEACLITLKMEETGEKT